MFDDIWEILTTFVSSILPKKLHLIASEITVSETASKFNMLKKLKLSKRFYTPDYARLYIFLGLVQRYENQTKFVLVYAMTQEMRDNGSLLLYTRQCEGAIYCWKKKKTVQIWSYG